MAAEREATKVALKYGSNGELIDEETGAILGYEERREDGAKTLIDALSNRFPENLVQWKPGNGRRPDLAYVSHALVTERLNHLAPGWSMVVKEVHTFTANNTLHCAGVTVSMTIDGITREEMGGPQRMEDFASECKNAMSDAVKRCAMRFGVALYLWDKLVDSQSDDDVNPEREAPEPQVQQQRAQQAQQSAQQNRARMTAHAPLRSRTAAAMERLEQDQANGVIGAHTIPDRAQRMTAQAQGPRQHGVDPATIPGVVKGVANAKPVSKYEEVYDPYTKMDTVRQAMAEVGVVAQGQQNMNDCRIAVNQWVKQNFPTHGGDAVVGTGSWNEKYGRNDLRPCDIANAVYHFSQQLNGDGAQEAAQAAERDSDDGWGDEDDSVPF